MRLNFTLTSILLVFFFAAGAQNLTGIWRGYFSSSNGLYREDVRQEMYKYEVQIDQQANNALKGVTYSYKSTVFYGKAALQGIYTIQTKNLILKETTLEEVKIGDKSEPCLMTCYLEYSRIGKLEVLQGTFISVNINSKVDCGNGKVYLERVKESDFELEPFLLKKKPGPVQKQPDNKTAKKTVTTPPSKKDNTVKTAPAQVKKAPVTTPAKTNTTVRQPQEKNNTGKTTSPQKSTTPAKSGVTSKNNTKSKVTNPPAATQPPVTLNNLKPEATISSRKTDTASIVKWEQPPAKQGPIPRVLVERENNLVKTILTNERVLTVDIFDNGTIDNDTISLYHNNQLVISHGKLNYTPLRFKIQCSNEEQKHELILVAENLGEIPPNTALMVITAGKKRYEIFLTSNEKRNAKVVIEYKPE